MMKQFPCLAARENLATRNFQDLSKIELYKFERDKNRIFFSKEFRRLDGKTQVFISGYDDHVRNRLTHTLEVSLISQIIVNLFGFNKTLTEAIALGHDVGHTPFGHVGERILNHLTNNCDSFKDFHSNQKELGFKHNWQGIKVVSTLEKIDPNFRGLNLTDYTLWGILHHSNQTYGICKKIDNKKCTYNHNGKDCHITDQKLLLTHYDKFKSYIKPNSWSFEAYIVAISDEIAQRHHDIEDSLIAGIMDKDYLLEIFIQTFNKYLKNKHLKEIRVIKNNSSLNYTIHNLSHLILNFYVDMLCEESNKNLKEFIKINGIHTPEDFDSLKIKNAFSYPFENVISFSDGFKECDNKFQNFLYGSILNSHLAQSMDGKATFILRRLIKAYLSNPKQLPDGTVITLFDNFLLSEEFEKIRSNKKPETVASIFRSEIDSYHNKNNDNYKTSLIRTVTDFIAGMTDNYAISQYHMLYGSDNYWKK